MTHQEHIAKVITSILGLEPAIVEAFCRSNPFGMLLRSYDEHNEQGEGLYKNNRGRFHYRYSVAAVQSGLPAKELYGEHRIPLKVVRARLLASDRSLDSVRKILQENEVVLVTHDEGKRLDRARSKGGHGLKDKMPLCGSCRFVIAGIEIAESTRSNGLHMPPP